MSEPTRLSLEEARQVGMHIAVHAREHPGRIAITSEAGTLSFYELNARANQLVRALRGRGLAAGDAVALLCSNRPEFAEVWAAVQRTGFRLTCINWHLHPDEIAYIVENCEAKAFLAEARFAEAAVAAAKSAPAASVLLSIAGAIEGFDAYDAELSLEEGHDIDDPGQGGSMLYTSGTTGLPKGVYRKRTPPPSPIAGPIQRTAAWNGDTDKCLCTGPLYHAAPLAFNLVTPLVAGIGVYLMDGWEAEQTLALVESERITHTHMVATMFHRLLALPDETKARYDTTSLRFVIHGAAPTPVPVKKGVLEWWGPIVYEYYAATEGGGTYITPEEWLKKPGSVGKPADEGLVEIRNDAGEPVPPNEIGTVFFRAPKYGRFEYFKDDDKTDSSYAGDYFTLKDMGYLDEDHYLFLTGRTSELIISGGVNIYPAEVDAVLLMHPAVGDVACVGVPNEEWGEEVKAVVQLADGHEPAHELETELMAFARERLAHYKCPRSVDFASDLPRTDAGKIYRRRVRDRYWAESRS